MTDAYINMVEGSQLGQLTHEGLREVVNTYGVQTTLIDPDEKFTAYDVVSEPHPPSDSKPLRWLLLTSLPITTWAEAVAVVGYYRARWVIERYHYVLKSGCGIEQLQLETARRLERALAVFSIVAWRLLWLTYAARHQPERLCSDILATREWRALYVHHHTTCPPTSPPTLHEAIRWIAQLGGFLVATCSMRPF